MLKTLLISLLLAVSTAQAATPIRPGTTLRVNTVSANYTATSGDDVILVNASGGAVTVTLPAPATMLGKVINIQKTDTSANTVTINGDVNGYGVNYIVFAPNSYVELVGDGTRYRVKTERNPWYVDASITGSAVTAGTAASYTGLENGSLSLANNNVVGGISAKIPCSGTNPPTGTTCAVGNELLGVSFNLPVSNLNVEACFYFSATWGISDFNARTETFTTQVVETPNNAQTVSQQGNSRIFNYFTLSGSLSANQFFIYTPFTVCGTLAFTSAGQKTIRLMYIDPAGGNDGIIANDVHVTVRPL